MATRWRSCIATTSRGIQRNVCGGAGRQSNVAFSTSLRRQQSSSSSSDAINPPQNETNLSAEIRKIMRTSAQPVAVITTNLRPQNDEGEGSEAGQAGEALKSSKIRRGLSHGATLSSFTTVSLDPPLIAFSLRTPSRMADALSDAQAQDAEDGHSSTARFVINVLSDAQAFAAQSFATPGLPPYVRYEDWALDADMDEVDAVGDSLANDDMAPHPLDRIPYHDASLARSRQEDDDDETAVPVLSQSIGAFACSLVKRINLETFVADAGQRKGDVQTKPSMQGSDLFLARVHGLEDVAPAGEERSGRKRKPLVYHEQGFTTISDERIEPVEPAFEADEDEVRSLN